MAAFLWAGRTDGAVRILSLLGAVLAIQLRLLCNLLDGMVAVEHGRGGPSGPIWNELPDRISDSMLLVGAGYAAAAGGLGWASGVGWIAALLAVLTAYVRELGRGLGQPPDFTGPGAKPQRMAVLSVAALASAAVEPRWAPPGTLLAAGVALTAVLAGLTVVRRTQHLATRLGA
jgi:phosphatidylglycerophosphate synthase